MHAKARLTSKAMATLIPVALFGCIGVSAQRVNPDGTIAPPRYCARGTQIAADGLIDDMEDGDNKIDATAGRGGYWWKSADSMGSEIGPADFVPELSPDTGNMAFHAFGNTVEVGGDDNWGVQFGADFSQTPGYDASKYVGIRFRAKAGPGSASTIRFKVADVNTHPKMGKCTSCWNHFGRDINLSEEWREYEFMFAALEQAPHWGDPRPPSVTPAKLYGFDFQVSPGKKFDVWIDDLAFIECK
jgi:endoglucanase